MMYKCVVRAEGEPKAETWRWSRWAAGKEAGKRECEWGSERDARVEKSSKARRKARDSVSSRRAVAALEKRPCTRYISQLIHHSSVIPRFKALVVLDTAWII